MARYDEFDIFDFVLGISEALDLVSPDVNHHHKRVAYIAYSLAREMSLEDEEVFDLVMAATVHDIGAFSQRERLIIHGRAPAEDFNFNDHATVGYLLMRTFPPFKALADMVRYHHHFYRGLDGPVPRGAYIINLADKIAIAIDDEREILEQVRSIVDAVKNGPYWPEAVEAFLLLAEREHFWLDARSSDVDRLLAPRIQPMRRVMGFDMLLSFAKMMAQMIDFRSRFTATHSSGVAAVALDLTGLFEFSPRECRLMEISGYLHDLGKLAVPNEILDKPGKLGYEDVNVMRKHTYHTYQVLSRIRGLEDVTRWAAYHHERLDGRGYPFHIGAEDFTKLARIMAVADIFTAITEDRPYRVGMERDSAMKVLNSMAAQNGIDGEVVKMVAANYDRINQKRALAQGAALDEYNKFTAQSAANSS